VSAEEIINDLIAQEQAAIEENVARLLRAGWSVDELEFRKFKDKPFYYQELWGRGVCLLSSEFIFEGTGVKYQMTPYPYGRLGSNAKNG
jgi:hypothetical protein